MHFDIKSFLKGSFKEVMVSWEALTAMGVSAVPMFRFYAGLSLSLTYSSMASRVVPTTKR